MISTITIESKNRYKRMVVAFALCISLLIGSAFAVHPVKSVVSMPDPYGIMPLSMNDAKDASIKFSGTVNYGAYSPSSKRTTFSSGYSYTGISYSGNARINYYSPGSSVTGDYMKVNSGSYFEYVCNFPVSNTEYQSIVIGGGGSCRLLLYQVSNPTLYAYPNTVQMLVNGAVVGDSYSVSSSGQFTIPDLEVVLNSAVTTIGFRCTWTSADTVSNTSGANSNQRSLDLYWTDNISVTPVAFEAVDYTPLLERIIGWEQSIYGAISNLADSISSSFGDVGQSANKIANVFARDDDIQLRDDVDDTLKEVTTQFYDQTSPSSSSITVETVQNVKGIADGTDALFNTGYEISDAFTEIADNDDFMAWFTVETAAALDSTGSVATVDDEDPFNMHFYYDQMNVIAGKRGD